MPSLWDYPWKKMADNTSFLFTTAAPHALSGRSGLRRSSSRRFHLILIMRLSVICGLILSLAAASQAALIADWQFDTAGSFAPTSTGSGFTVGNLAPSAGILPTVTGGTLHYSLQNGNHYADLNGSVITLTFTPTAGDWTSFAVSYDVTSVGQSSLA